MGTTHLDDVPATDRAHGDTYGSSFRRISRASGGQKLHCSHYEVPPGRTAFPLHAHHGTEEALFVLEGTGTLRIGDQTVALRPGSYASFPPGNEHAHQLVNTGKTPLRYLCMSADADPDVVEYPDSGKVMLYGGYSDGWPPAVMGIYKQGTEVGYYDED